MEPMPLLVPSTYSPLLETWIRGMAPHAVFLFVLNALLVVPFSLAQSFTVPSYWRKPTSTHSRQELLQLVDGVLNTITHSLNVTNGQFIGLQPLQSASMVSALSIGDALNGSTTNEGVVRESLSSVFTLTPNITSIQTPQTNDNPAIWGLAALDAYKAYNDTRFFSYADSMWTQLNEYMVTLDQAALVSATHPMRTINFPGSCNQISNAGGIFYLSGSTNDTTVDGQSTATFMALSAHLYEQTLHPQYLSAATLSANFVLDQLTNGNVILDSMLLETCSKSTTIWTSNSAYAIYGLSALASKNVSYAPRLSQLVSTVVPNLQWTNSSDGVNIEGPPDAERAKLNGPHVALKGIFIRSLYQAYTRIESDSPEATLLRSYINVQLNAIVDLATIPGANQYSPRWEGPPPSGLLLQGQLAAVDVLYSSLGLVKSQNTSTNTSTGATDTSPLPGITATGISQAAGNVHRISPGAVGGIVVAGITTLLLIIAAALFIVKRKRLQGNPSVVLETTARPYTPPIVERRMALSCGHSSDRLIIPPSKHSRSDPSGMEGTDSIPGPSTSDIFATDLMASPYFSQPQAHRGEEGYPAGERPYVMNLVASPALIDHLNRFIPPESPIGYARDEPPRYVR